MTDWLADLTARIHWDAWGTLATLAAVVAAIWAALLPGWAEEKRRKAQAKSLRGRLATTLGTIRPTFLVLSHNVHSGGVPPETRNQKLTQDRLIEVVEKVDRLAAESHTLEPDEQNLLTWILANASLLAEIYRTNEGNVPRETAAKVSAKILELEELFKKHGYFH